MSLFRINTNITAQFTQRQLRGANNKLSEAQQRLSSGLRINSAADDAAGLAISQKTTAQIKGLAQATRNSQDGISLIQTAEGALEESQSSLQRMRELAVQSANDTLTKSDRDKLQSEVNALAAEIQRISEDTQFNEKKLLDGSLSSAQIQVGANEGQTISLSVDDMGTEDSALNVAEFSATDTTIQSIGVTTSTGGGTADIGSNANGTFSIVRDGSGTLTIENSSGTKVAEAVTSGGKNEGVVFEGVTTDGGSGFGDDRISFEAAVTEGSFNIVSTAVGSSAVQTSTISTQALEDGIAKNSLTAGTFEVQSSSTAGEFKLVDEEGNVVGVTGSSGNITGQFVDPSDSSSVVLDFNNSVNSSIIASSSPSQGVFSGDEEITVGGPNISQSTSEANNAITQLDEAIAEVSEQRSDLGALQNRLETTISANSITEENLNAARSRIRDADIAKESVKQTRANILIQASTSVLSQANQNPQLALQLLG